MELDSEIEAALKGLVKGYVEEFGDALNKNTQPVITLSEVAGIFPNGFVKLAIQFKLEDLDASAIAQLAILINNIENVLRPLELGDVMLASYFANELVTIKACGWYKPIQRVAI